MFVWVVFPEKVRRELGSRGRCIIYGDLSFFSVMIHVIFPNDGRLYTKVTCIERKWKYGFRPPGAISLTLAIRS